MARIDKYDFSGGQNSQVSPLIIKDNQCEIIQNYHLDNVGSLTKRNGIVYLIGQIVDTKSILGMYYFADQQGTDYSNVLVASDVAGGATSTIYKITTNAWANSKTGDTAGALPVFCSFIDYAFRTNGSDVMGSSADLATWSTTNCLATYKFKYNCVWEDRIYVLNDNSTTKYPSRIAWSSLPSGSPLAITWAYDGTTATGKDSADINPDDNDQITWGEPFGNVMLIFKTKGLYRWTFGQVEPDKIISVGTSQGRTVKQTQGICFFANEYGIWAYTSGKPKIISRKVKPFVGAISSFTNLRAEVDDDHYYLYIGDVTVKGITYNNCMLVYTISLDAWHIETYPFEIKSMTRFLSKTLGSTVLYDAIYLGDDDGFVYRKGTGYTDYLGTTGTAIDGVVKTKEYSLNFPKTSDLEQLYVTAQMAQGVKVNYKIDRMGEFKSWKDLTQRITDGKLSGRAKTLQLEFTDNSTTIASQIEGFTLEYNPKEEIRRKQV